MLSIMLLIICEGQIDKDYSNVCLQDLKERLWDVCDYRRDEAGKERNSILSNRWLEDHVGLICNQYITLMQVHVRVLIVVPGRL